MHAKRVLVILLSFALLAGASQSVVSAESFKVFFKEFQLDNGLRVVLSEDHAAPVVAVAVYYDVGSRNEVKGRSGFAHLFEHMMFQGSENVGKAEHFRYIESNGGIMNGETHADYTDYYELLPSNQLELALWLESDRMRSLRITPENLQNQKEAVKEEKRLSYDNQAYWPALLKMDEMVFHNWTNAHPTIGSMEDLDAATIEDVKSFFDTYYAPNNAVLTIVGDIDEARAEALVHKYFDSIPRQKTPPAVDVTEPDGVVTRERTATDTLAETPAVAIAWKIPARRTRDWYAIALLKSILFDGDSSRLYQSLVKKRAVSLEVQGTLEGRRGPGQLAVFTIHKSNVKSELVRSIIETEIERVKKEGVGVDELKKAKNQLRLDRFICISEIECTSLQSALGRALALAEFTMFDGDPSLINTELDRYLAVTPEQVRDAARKYFAELNTAVLYIKPAKDNAQR
ncbi:MAG TPA: pitrilysin family protein [Blastocatellia bacterium]|nr:pitrilysin family protein [Blastocatellia bacterium]